MFDVLNILVPDDLLSTFVNLIGFVAALDCISIFAYVLSGGRRSVSGK